MRFQASSMFPCSMSNQQRGKGGLTYFLFYNTRQGEHSPDRFNICPHYIFRKTQPVQIKASQIYQLSSKVLPSFSSTFIFLHLPSLTVAPAGNLLVGHMHGIPFQGIPGFLHLHKHFTHSCVCDFGFIAGGEARGLRSTLKISTLLGQKILILRVIFPHFVDYNSNFLYYLIFISFFCPLVVTLKLEADALNCQDPTMAQNSGSTPTLFLTLIIVITENNTQMTCLSYFLLISFPYTSRE